jgi:hypothetical protein
VCKLSKLDDTCHIEAAKTSVYNAKIYSDKFKLAAECKCSLDDVVTSGNLKGLNSLKFLACSCSEYRPMSVT